MSKNTLAAVWRHTPPFLRRWATRLAQSKFTVSAGAVVVREDGRVLLLQHRFRPGSGLGIPGGFMAHREQPEAAVRRELREETGLELTNVLQLETRTLGKHVEVIFVARPAGTVEIEGWEIASAEWCDPENLPAGLNRGQRDLIERAVRLIGASSI
jgi:8-oxo-dGTP diphosphatase